MPKPGVSNNLLGDLPNSAKERRDEIEQQIAALNYVLVDLHELSLRVNQAVSRTAAVRPVLQPAQERLDKTQAIVLSLKKSLGEYWNIKQEQRWAAGD